MTFEDQVDALDNVTPKNEKISWKRKQKNIEKFVEELEPLEEEIMNLMAKKAKIVDKIISTRATMVAECIHPADSLTPSADGTCMYCKFCERSIGLVNSANG